MQKPRFSHSQIIKRKLLLINSSRRRRNNQLKLAEKRKLQYNLSAESKRLFYNSIHYLYLREYTFSIYVRECVCCGSVNNLQCDHIKPISTHPDLALCINNTQILCRSCNETKSNYSQHRFKRRLNKKCTINFDDKDRLKFKRLWKIYFKK